MRRQLSSVNVPLDMKDRPARNAPTDTTAEKAFISANAFPATATETLRPVTNILARVLDAEDRHLGQNVISADTATRKFEVATASEFQLFRAKLMM